MSTTDENTRATRQQILEIIYRRRQRECDTGIGASIEREIRSREYAERQAEAAAHQELHQTFERP